ncbi:MAG: hypothetical protein IJU50_06525 [Lachnospiraceae bacterium]|nr:hypothetical protein [Lachnospiraceae bacterium]
MNFDFEVRKLTQRFYLERPIQEFRDLLRKHERGYSTLLVDTHSDYYICIPFRSEIGHEYAYKFRHSIRSQRSHSGLDYTKICIINDGNYIDEKPAVVDQDEYREMRDNIETIVDEAVSYINVYIDHVKGISRLNNRQYRKKYWYTTLKYFHAELGI